MLPYPLNRIDEALLQTILGNADYAENRTLEYKESLPGKAQSEREPFVASVASFANENGGDLLIGVKAEQGVPTQLPGVDVQDRDQTRLQFDSVIRQGLDPTFGDFAIADIPLAIGRTVWLIRVQQSWNRPHRVRANSKFYGRASASRYEMGVEELRRLFGQAQARIDYIRAFIRTRRELLANDEGPVTFRAPAVLALHLVPLDALESPLRFSISRLRDIQELRPLTEHVTGVKSISRPTFDGLLHVARIEPVFGGGDASYLLAFYNGSVEAAEALGWGQPKEAAAEYLPLDVVERRIRQGVKKYLKAFEELPVRPPYLLFVSLFGVNGLRLVHGSTTVGAGARVDRNRLLLPEVAIEQTSGEIEAVLTPLFELIWAAGGAERAAFPQLIQE